jgi:hypothetical protein
MAHLLGIHRHLIKSEKRARGRQASGASATMSRLPQTTSPCSFRERSCRFRTAVQGNAGKSFKGRSRAHQTLEMDRELDLRARSAHSWGYAEHHECYLN